MTAILLSFTALLLAGAEDQGVFDAARVLSSTSVTASSKPGVRFEVAVGSSLRQDDTIRGGPDSEITMMCSDGRIRRLEGPFEWRVGSDVQAATTISIVLPERLVRQIIDHPGVDANRASAAPQRDPANIALAPSRTKVFFERDIFLVWQPNPSIPSYTLTFLGPDGVPTKDRVEGHYARKTSGSLSPGAEYFWQVKDGSDGDSYSPLGAARFATLEGEEAEEISELVSQIDAVFPPADASADTSGLFLKFQLFHAHDLHLDALITLEELMWRGVINHDITTWRRDLCRIMGIEETQIRYLQSPFKTNAAQ